jgi:hypothetical protein
MSAVYRITVGATLQRVVHLEDAVQTELTLLPILPADALAALLADALVERGFAVADGHARRSHADGVQVDVDLARGTVTLTRAEDATVTADAQGTATSAPEASARASALAERRADAAADTARRALTDALADALHALRAELDAVAKAVDARALAVRAASLGEVVSVQETPDGAVTIRVRL